MDRPGYTVKTGSAAETERIAEEFAAKISPDATIALFGGMGMGKTAFVRGLARGLGLDENSVSSPTFAIIHEHYGPGGERILCHYDMYRISGWEDLETTGFFDTLERCVNVIEWSENIEEELPLPRWNIRFEHGDGADDRILAFEYMEKDSFTPSAGGT